MKFFIALCFIFSGSAFSTVIKNEGPPGWYSGSYLPFSDGPLTEDKNKNSGEKKKMSTAQRLDKASAAYSSNASSVEGFLRDYIYNKTAPDWQGLCDQWSASNNDIEIKKNLMSAKKLKCKGGVVFTKGDIQELFTGFYKSWDIDYAGSRDYTPLEERESSYYFSMDQLNSSNFPAHVVHEKVHYYMSKKVWEEEKVGIVLNVDSGPEVWNQPVISIESEIKELGMKDLAKGSLKVFAGQDHINLDGEQKKYTRTEVAGFRIPSSLLKAKKNDKDLRLIEKIEEDYFERVVENPEISVKELRKGEPKYIGTALKEIAKKNSFSDSKSFVKALALVKNETLKRALGNNISLKKGIKVQFVASKLKYQEETYYKDTQDVSNTKYYNYLLFKKKGEVIGSSWITPLRERPGDLFISPSTLQEQVDLANNFTEYFEKGKWAMYKGVGPIALRWFKDQAKEKFHDWKKFKKTFSSIDKSKTVEQWFQETTQSKSRPKRTYGMTETPEWEFYEMVGKAIGIRNTLNLYKNCDKVK